MFEHPKCKDCLNKSSATKVLNDSQIEQLGNNCAVINLKKGEFIFKQGIFSSNIVYLKEGVVKLFAEGPNKEQILKIAKGPTYLGIPTTIGEKYNRYSASVLEDIKACFIDANTFKTFIKENGDFSYEIIVELCRNEINLFNKCVNLAQKNASGRLADAILMFYNEIYHTKTFRMPLTRKELGDYVDTTRESVSRILSEFMTDGIIKLDKKEITILDFNKLKLISKTG